MVTVAVGAQFGEFRLEEFIKEGLSTRLARGRSTVTGKPVTLKILTEEAAASKVRNVFSRLCSQSRDSFCPYLVWRWRRNRSALSHEPSRLVMLCFRLLSICSASCKCEQEFKLLLARLTASV